MRSTCRQLRQIDAQEIRTTALLRLEDDITQVTIRAKAHAIELGITYNRPSLDVFCAWGYHPTDMLQIAQYSPCYTCLQLREFGQHFTDLTLDDCADAVATLADSYQYIPRALPRRKCIECVMQSQTYSDNVGGRWLGVNNGNGNGYWIAICRACNETSTNRMRPPLRQRSADLCNRCYEAAHQEWFRHKDKILQAQSVVAQEKIELEIARTKLVEKQAELRRYINWVYAVEEGQSVVGDYPPVLEGLATPDWREVRADAIEELQGCRWLDPALPTPWEAGIFYTRSR